ncbi:hypothetical protein QR680_016456 [Steinernema hermaphroditum]|uniref:Serpentine receptor class gamma n=1 Tax=Steinernema hermaphroditum TaxID=289476 RepID=A0AA39HBA0_9BILA|nr:hypothetical protein QR680_016456 [Steinernema hermaphroditum]
MSMSVLQFVLTIFALVSAVLNLTIIISIRRHRKDNTILKGSFFSLTTIQSAADILLACETALLMRARKYRYLDFMLVEGNALWYILPWVTNFFNYHIKGVIYLGHILLSFNRFTAVFFPLKYESFWDSKPMKFVKAFIWIIPSFFYLPIVLNFNYHMWYSMGTNNETVRLQMDDESTQLISYFDASLSFGATVISFIFHLSSAFKISKQMITHNINQYHSIEIRLFIASVLLFILLSLNTTVHIAAIVVSNTGNTVLVMWLYDLSYPMLDMLCSANPWILCLTSSATRDAVKRLLLPSKKDEVTSIRLVSPSTNSAI